MKEGKTSASQIKCSWNAEFYLGEKTRDKIPPSTGRSHVAGSHCGEEKYNTMNMQIG
jgi:hypothetical protein